MLYNRLLYTCFFCSLRKQTNVLTLNNTTLLPVAWKLSGLEQLGEEFTFGQDHGIVQPKSSFPLQVHFRAAKPVGTKKAFKIEVCRYTQYDSLPTTCLQHLKD